MKMKTHIPMDDEYTALLGQAVYSFSYYEWTIIYILDHLDNGFVSRYCRGKPLSSGGVLGKFDEILVNNDNATLLKCRNDFALLKEERNALIHAHPITSDEGKQILNYQASIKKDIHDLQWKAEKIVEFIHKVNDAEIEAAHILDSYR